MQRKSGDGICHPLGAADHTPGLHGLGAGGLFRFCIPVVTTMLEDIGFCRTKRVSLKMAGCKI